jgi:hypothetical protein
MTRELFESVILIEPHITTNPHVGDFMGLCARIFEVCGFFAVWVWFLGVILLGCAAVNFNTSELLLADSSPPLSLASCQHLDIVFWVSFLEGTVSI